VPGNITTRSSAGVNRLIQDGAHPVLEARDVLEVLNLEQVVQFNSAREVLPELSDDEDTVLRALSAEPRHIDEIAQACGLPVHRITGSLTLLQLKGMVREVGAMIYVRN